MRFASGGDVDVIVTSTPSSALTLGFDPASKQLRAILKVQPDPLAGDATTETEFFDYLKVGSILMPGERVTRVADEITRRVRYTAGNLDPHVPDSLLAAPRGFSEPTSRPARSNEPVQELATGVWAIRESGSWSLAVEFADHVLVVEAPTSGASATSARIATLAPGKPIRYLVLTHRHDDHARRGAPLCHRWGDHSNDARESSVLRADGEGPFDSSARRRAGSDAEAADLCPVM